MLGRGTYPWNLLIWYKHIIINHFLVIPNLDFQKLGLGLSDSVLVLHKTLARLMQFSQIT